MVLEDAGYEVETLTDGRPPYYEVTAAYTLAFSSSLKQRMGCNRAAQEHDPTEHGSWFRQPWAKKEHALKLAKEVVGYFFRGTFAKLLRAPQRCSTGNRVVVTSPSSPF